MADLVDIAVIGAGVIGLAVAAEVAREGRNVYVIERGETFGREASSRNSGVIHAGIYYPEGSLKARLCVEGNRLLYELCERYGIAHRRTGKLIVAVSDDEVAQLESLRERGERNGADGLRMISMKQLKSLEPNVEGIAALFSSSTGVVDAHALMRYYLVRAQDEDAHIVFNTEVVAIERANDGYRVSVDDGSGSFSILSRVVINCAGLDCDEVANMTGIDVDNAGYRLHYCKGEYFSVGGGKSKYIEHLIYPVPLPRVTGVGIHVTLDLDGRMLLGPSAEYVDKVDYAIDNRNQKAFYESVKPFLPFIEYEDLAPEMAGVRAKLQGPDDDIRDFVIREESDRDLPGLIDLIGIESPGLTASPAIARYVGGIVDGVLG
ncbi:MAG: NAD(P)/FAD-dependent oxidoreductase [Chloroflexota bacterium]|nr:NAD(P)/FAD-dependent oxidoreductase [Chloroflexota bacterium]